MNFTKAQKNYKKLFKAVIFSALIIFISVMNNSAQSIRIEESDNDSMNQYSVCGQIENEELTIPSYKFRVTDKNGNRNGNLRAEGKLSIEEYVWTGTGISILDALGDPYWKRINHDISIPITYNFDEGIYISQKVLKIQVAKGRKRRFKHKSNCLDKITKLHFSFYQNDCDSTSFIFFFPNKTINKINLPSPEKIYNLGVIDGYSCIQRR